MGIGSDRATAHVDRCILNPSRVKPDGRTTQLPPPFSHRPLHGCSHSGGFLCYVTRMAYLQEKVDEKLVVLLHIDTNGMIADIGTKMLSATEFHRLRELLVRAP